LTLAGSRFMFLLAIYFTLCWI